MKKLNCWEFKKCGREPGGKKVSELGECEAATRGVADGMNDGQNGGRVCWAVSGTLCGGKVQGVFATKVSSCLECDFFKLVLKEEGPNLLRLSKIIRVFKDYGVYKLQDTATGS
ncbi:MAG: hypothetical protein KKB30_14650 [Proteobacteria bacterium]|nr:hypothetical protein [Pseudomonadota bacterium]MBU1717142.1 hypothetical protein [Pseudomonadota bacterium]